MSEWSNVTAEVVMRFVPQGHFENSPAIHRWERWLDESRQVPQGRQNVSRSFVPYGTFSSWLIGFSQR